MGTFGPAHLKPNWELGEIHVSVTVQTPALVEEEVGIHDRVQSPRPPLRSVLEETSGTEKP